MEKKKAGNLGEADNKIPFFFDKNDHSQKFPNKNVFTK